MSDSKSEMKLYYHNPYLTELTTEIESFRRDDNGVWYSFNKTIFYPKGGGQDSDHGSINEIDVQDVKSIEGKVWHLLDSDIKDPVTMKLDWDTRYANMQQHSGQHILSACFKNLYNLDTVSVHLGSEVTMIELNAPDIDEEILEKTEFMTNQIIRDQIPVTSVWTKKDSLGEYDLRRNIKSDDTDIRLVKIGDIDCVGCGGTHIRSTAEVGLIKIMGVEKIRNHIRVKIKIGKSAENYFSLLHRNLQKISNQLTTSIEDLPERINILLSEKRELAGKIKKANDLWLTEYAKNLTEKEFPGCFYLNDLDKEQLKNLSAHWLSLNQKPCLFISKEGSCTNFYLRYPQNFNLNAQDFTQTQRSRFGLKGGGGKDFTVGEITLESVDRESSEDFFRAFCEYVNRRGEK